MRGVRGRVQNNVSNAIFGGFGSRFLPQAGIDTDRTEPSDPGCAVFAASLLRVILGKACADAHPGGVRGNLVQGCGMAVVAATYACSDIERTGDSYVGVDCVEYFSRGYSRDPDGQGRHSLFRSDGGGSFGGCVPL